MMKSALFFLLLICSALARRSVPVDGSTKKAIWGEPYQPPRLFDTRQVLEHYMTAKDHSKTNNVQEVKRITKVDKISRGGAGTKNGLVWGLLKHNGRN